MLGAKATLDARVDLSLALTVDFYLTRVHYDLSIDDELSTVLAPRPIRPGLVAGLTFR